MYDFPFVNPFGAFVVLTATVVVNGDEVTIQQQVDHAAWRHIDADPQVRASYERALHQRLADALLDRLEPTITVHEPVRVGEAVSDALARADAGRRNQPADPVGEVR
ncbi:hypothetical protein ACFW5V_32475 [Streptomyces sp. NPDC058762]|uniref:hypothetical protein n=1 Tax=Streptomyces sp. NPDC058762 TaxID=3346629 RepID=UPI00368F2B97